MQLGDFVQTWEGKAKAMGISLVPGDSYGYFTALDTRVPPWQGCPAGLLSCGITSNGKVKGCLSLPDEFVEGDLRERDLWAIWFDPNSFVYTRGYCKEQLGSNCHDCVLAEQCRGGCTAMSYGASGRVHNNPYCFSSIGRQHEVHLADGQFAHSL